MRQNSSHFNILPSCMNDLIFKKVCYFVADLFYSKVYIFVEFVSIPTIDIILHKHTKIKYRMALYLIITPKK